MSKRSKSLIIVFLIIGIGTFFMWYWASGDWVHALELGIVGGTVVSLIVNLAVPFIRKQKKRGEKKNSS